MIPVRSTMEGQPDWRRGWFRKPVIVTDLGVRLPLLPLCPCRSVRSDRLVVSQETVGSNPIRGADAGWRSRQRAGLITRRSLVRSQVPLRRCSSIGGASRCQRGGCGFETRHLHWAVAARMAGTTHSCLGRDRQSRGLSDETCFYAASAPRGRDGSRLPKRPAKASGVTAA